MCLQLVGAYNILPGKNVFLVVEKVYGSHQKYFPGHIFTTTFIDFYAFERDLSEIWFKMLNFTLDIK